MRNLVSSRRRAPGRCALLGLLAVALPRAALGVNPEPAGWYAGDMHVHRSCGGSPESPSSIQQRMAPHDLAVLSLQADMGNGEVQNPTTDLPRVNGQDDPISTPGRIVHWDAEWHWDATYGQYAHRALGGHVLVLGASQAQQLWVEYTKLVLDWAHQRGAIAGFAHMQYLDDGLPDSLSCCTPIEYPVEVALGAADFIAEDVVPGDGAFAGMNPDAAMRAYYRLLNTGFRPGFAAGTDYPCNGGGGIGDLLTYVQVAGGQMTYRGWIEGIARGRTVVSRTGHEEFLDLVVNGAATPGDEVRLAAEGDLPVNVTWTADRTLSGTVEIVSNGVVVASRQASVTASAPFTMSASVPFPRSGWVVARRMGPGGHQVHTAAVFVIVGGAPIRVSAADASFYVQWMDRLLSRTSPGGEWASFFPTQRTAAQARYQAAKAVFQQIAAEAAAAEPPPTGTSIWPPSAAPGVADIGPDSPVELGVKFRSDVDGFVTGVRFYKSSANTGTHVGNLWTLGGTRLATVTFTGETGSGWQQADFAAPVPIAANTVYVASYHTNVGHYAEDQYAFQDAGVDSPPLHALRDGDAGPNAVYAYGSTSTFPTLPWRASNHWVDVSFRSASPVTSLSIAPADVAALSGTSVQFSATASHADGSTRDVSGQATWSSSSPAVASVSASGLATAAAPGASTITAALGGFTAAATLTVSPAPLAIITAALPGATLSLAYSAPLAATGGAQPYAWSIAAGTLPPGLALAPSGVVSGTPVAAGTFPLTFRVTDAQGASAERELGVTVSALADFTIWPGTAAPVRADYGPDQPIEVGVKFRSDWAGVVKGIRFYKSAANTGTHVGSLWTRTGTLLARATFVGETASGWQQVIFDAPVAIAANTVYVASYHANGGHYAADANYFAGSGFDNAPLHALRRNVSGANGVYVYSSASRFPNLARSSTNFWVDVVFGAVPPAALAAIAVAPADATVPEGGTRQFSATGTYTDGSVKDLTGSVTWTSSSPAVATVAAGGLTTAVGPGATTIAATSGAVVGATSLTVTPLPLAISTSALPEGSVGAAYAAALAASGGVRPYTWSISAGLPPGLSLDAGTGVVSGIPTAGGAFELTFQVSDASAATAARTLAIVIGPPVPQPTYHSLWPSTAAPSVADGGPDSPVEVGVRFGADQDGAVTAVRFYKSSANTGTHVANVWSSTGARLATATFTGESASGWQQVDLPSPVAVAAGTVYVASYHTDVGHYASDEYYFAAPLDRPPLHAPADGVSGFNGVYRYGSASAFPTDGWRSCNYWVDVVFVPAAPPP